MQLIGYSDGPIKLILFLWEKYIPSVFHRADVIAVFMDIHRPCVFTSPIKPKPWTILFSLWILTWVWLTQTGEFQLTWQLVEISSEEWKKRNKISWVPAGTEMMCQNNRSIHVYLKPVSKLGPFDIKLHHQRLKTKTQISWNLTPGS